MTRRVVVTGIGIVSSIGNNAEEVTDTIFTAHPNFDTSPPARKENNLPIIRNKGAPGG